MTSSTSTDKLFQEILKLDQIAFEAYNTCDLTAFKNFFVEDLEFYHDKSGLISSRTTMLAALENVLCGNNGIKTRRELIPESLKVYPLENFGAIQVGEHYYYQSRDGQPEKLVEVAKFTHIWKNTGESWKISRVLSYDHQPIGA